MKELRDIKTPDSILARLANKIYIQLGLDASKIKALIYKFVMSLESESDNKLYYTKINLFNELYKNKMTFKVFMKMLNVINIKKVKFVITITTQSDKEITVHEDISLFNISGINAMDDADEK